MKKLIAITMMAITIAGALYAINSYTNTKSNSAEAGCQGQRRGC